jgi:hypothetical protein
MAMNMRNSMQQAYSRHHDGKMRNIMQAYHGHHDGESEEKHAKNSRPTVGIMAVNMRKSMQKNSMAALL